MEQKTKVSAEDGKQELFINRVFDLPVELLFKAYTQAELIEQWMGNTVIKHENKRHGSYQFETKDKNGNTIFKSNGVIHEFEVNKKITRTFEMENTPYPIQLEFLEFEKLTKNTSQLTMHVVYKSVDVRDQILKLPFVFGINRAHDKLQEIAAI